MKRILITLSALLLIMTAGYAQKNIFEKIPLKEKYAKNYIVQVLIWADNGKVCSMYFMNEWGLDIEGLEKDNEHTIMPFWIPQSKEGTPLPVDSSKIVPRKFKVYK